MMIFKIGFLEFSLKDLIDILLVSFLIYKLYQVMEGTRAVKMIAGLILILILSFFVEAFEMSGMSWIIGNIKTVWIILFVIVFQPELRRILILVGQSRLLRAFFKVRERKIFDSIATAACELSQKGYGALIVLVRDMGIRAIVETGISIQAKVSSSLIVSIFSSHSPLHDGAIIINEDIIEAAKCILPLTQNPDIDKTIGTRHRAALGISEESDAVIVVVSEETGRISIAHKGQLISGLNYNSLMDMFSKMFQTSY